MVQKNRDIVNIRRWVIKGKVIGLSLGGLKTADGIIYRVELDI